MHNNRVTNQTDFMVKETKLLSFNQIAANIPPGDGAGPNKLSHSMKSDNRSRVSSSAFSMSAGVTSSQRQSSINKQRKGQTYCFDDQDDAY